MVLANSTEEYIKLTSGDTAFLKTKEQIDEWTKTDDILKKISDDQIQKFKSSIHYSAKGTGIGDFYFADLEGGLTKEEFENFLSKIGISIDFFGVIRDAYCKDSQNCAPMTGYACPYLYGLGCAG